MRDEIKRIIAEITVCPQCNHLAKELWKHINALDKIDETKLKSIISDSITTQFNAHQLWVVDSTEILMNIDVKDLKKAHKKKMKRLINPLAHTIPQKQKEWMK